MQLTQHPNHPIYVQDRQFDQRVREAVAAWEAGPEPASADDLSRLWTFASAQKFAHQLSHLTQEYSRVLWERFPYCRQCGGQCCVVNAVKVDVFDSIMLALLGESFPMLPAEIDATARDCVYRTAKGCAWPPTWKPVKCWTYYCLGRSGSELPRYWHPADSADARYAAIADELTGVILELMPLALREYEIDFDDPLEAYLGDPLDFTDALNGALFEVFISPFDHRYPIIDK
jgi:hypothetical protein